MILGSCIYNPLVGLPISINFVKKIAMAHMKFEGPSFYCLWCSQETWIRFIHHALLMLTTFRPFYLERPSHEERHFCCGYLCRSPCQTLLSSLGMATGRGWGGGLFP